jgi:hypothetical protein
MYHKKINDDNNSNMNIVDRHKVTDSNFGCSTLFIVIYIYIYI